MLADRQRGHQEARLDRLRGAVGLFEEFPRRQAVAGLGRLAADETGLGGVAAEAPVVADADDIFGGRRCQDLVQLLAPTGQRVSVHGAQRREGRVGPQLVVSPFLQQGPFDHLGYLGRLNLFGDAEVNGCIQAVGGQTSTRGLEGVPFAGPAGVVEHGFEQCSPGLVVVQFASQFLAARRAERPQQRGAGRLPGVRGAGEAAGGDGAFGRMKGRRGERTGPAADHCAQPPRPSQPVAQRREVGGSSRIQRPAQVLEDRVPGGQLCVRGVGRLPQGHQLPGLAEREWPAHGLADHAGDLTGGVQRLQVGPQPPDGPGDRAVQQLGT